MQRLREEFRPKYLGFSGIHPGRFYTFQWRCVPPWLHLLYRIGLAAYVVSWLVYSKVLHVEHNGSTLPFMAFLTNWTYSLLAAYLVLHALCALSRRIFLCSQGRSSCRLPDQRDHLRLFTELQSWDVEESQLLGNDSEQEGERRMPPTPPVPWYLKLTSILFSAVSCSAIVVTSVFYIFLLQGNNGFSMENLQVHFLNTVIIVLEHLTTALPVRLLHVVYPAMYLLAYVLFSVFYWIPDHNHTMYPNVLDWNTPGKTLGMLALVGFVILPLIHCVFYVIYRIKCAILPKCC